MIKVVSLLYRNQALSTQQFRDYWHQVHVPLVRAALPGLIHYTGSFPVADNRPWRPGAGLDYDGIVELGWADEATMVRDLGSPAFNTPEREASSAHLMDLPRIQTVVVEVVDALA
jgi:EthD domain